MAEARLATLVAYEGDGDAAPWLQQRTFIDRTLIMYGLWRSDPKLQLDEFLSPGPAGEA